MSSQINANDIEPEKNETVTNLREDNLHIKWNFSECSSLSLFVCVKNMKYKINTFSLWQGKKKKGESREKRLQRGVRLFRLMLCRIFNYEIRNQLSVENKRCHKIAVE